ncbi:uncharacterized protein LOC127703079 isoform X3 [Mytilus californianus]|uniref:uncharacterized protein LOC127703079 isoform X3 n=1 Tax=Mytilus californianus TaxID=6549 RepID=UPI0022476A83|nr:uncharacterized protein LOC127703079 isoform X3 [Mytilus californianus]
MEDENSMSAAPVNNPESPTMITQGFETQQVQTNRIHQEELSVQKLKMFGRLQIFLGFLLVILSSIRLVLNWISMQNYNDCFNNEYYYYFDHYDNSYHPYLPHYVLCNRYYNSHLQLPFDITSLICSGWCILTGILPFCMRNRRKANWRCLKTAFMVCNIIAASVLVPGIYILRVIEAIIRDTYESKVVILLSFMTVVSFAEVIVAIMAASYCCCCSTWGTSDQQGVVFVNGTQPELFLDLQTNIGNVQPPMDNTGHIDIPTVSYPRANQYQENTTNEQIGPNIQTVEGTLPKIDSTQQEAFDTNPLPYKV